MNRTILIQTQDSEKLKMLFKKITFIFDISTIDLLLHSKNYEPWQDASHYATITSFKSYFAFPSDLTASESVVELLINSKTTEIIITDENSENNPFHYFQTKDILKLNLDTKYKSLKWFLIDLISQKSGIPEYEQDESSDCQRYLAKINSPFFKERIIYIDGGMGDHIMSLPLITKLSKDIYVSCKYPFIYDNLNIKGIIDWNDELFGGYNRFVYAWGSAHNSKTIIDAFFEIYSEKRENADRLVYDGIKQENIEINTDKKIALICTSAAKINNQDSNKDWRDIRWFKLIHELQKENYYIIQVGSKNDNQIPNVNLKFLDKTLPELAAIVDRSDLWISVDTFFHHFASAIKPHVGICLTPFYNDHAKHPGVRYVEKNCGKNFFERRWWLDLQQPERKECMELIEVEDVLKETSNFKNNDYAIALVCVAKDEEKYIDEWIDYNLKLGFDKIFIFQNDWEYKINHPQVHCERFDGKQIQNLCYNEFIRKYHNIYKWVAFFDVDEFLVLKKHKNIRDFIEDYKDYDAIAVNWVLFGDSNLSDKEIKNFFVVNRFTKRQADVNAHIKSIIKIKENQLFIDNSHSVEGITWVDTNYQTGTGPFNFDGNDNVAQINHYFTKTKKEFLKKIERGRADFNLKRTEEEFDTHNFNEEYDFYAVLFSRDKSMVEFIIPTYNRYNPLKCLLASLMCQNDDDWTAHVVIDDSDNIEIVDLINSFNTKKIYYTFTGKNFNDFGHTPRELGKNLSIADYIIMTGDDNYYVPTLVEEIRKSKKDSPIMIYWDMVHNHNHYQTKKDYSYWKTLLVCSGIDVGSFATRNDILLNEKLNKGFSADGELVENILKKYSMDSYNQYLGIINDMIVEKNFSKTLCEVDWVFKIDKVLYTHN